jgi:hypothetical protein
VSGLNGQPHPVRRSGGGPLVFALIWLGVASPLFFAALWTGLLIEDGSAFLTAPDSCPGRAAAKLATNRLRELVTCSSTAQLSNEFAHVDAGERERNDALYGSQLVVAVQPGP